MTLIVLGVALWWVAHLFKRIAPQARARLGDPGKALVALAVILSVVLMVLGFRAAPQVDLWYPPPWLVHVNNLLMALAFFLFAADGMRSAVVVRMRHPQLTGFSAWAVAHLLVNGDLAGVILFGGLLAWAVVTMVAISRSQPEWQPKPAKPGGTPKALAATIFAMVAVMMIHDWLGVQPWGG